VGLKNNIRSNAMSTDSQNESESRKLNPEFLKDLKEGILSPILDAVKKDDNLILEIRNNCIDIYYRGGKLLELTQSKDDNEPPKISYSVDFTEEYISTNQNDFLYSCKEIKEKKKEIKKKEKEGIKISKEEINELEEKAKILDAEKIISEKDKAEKWAWLFFHIKREMDIHLTKKNNLEREFQQLVVRENNILGKANLTDYYIIDIEYKAKIPNKDPEFDFVALRWDADPQKRKRPKNCQIAIIEMKYGDGSLNDPENKTGLKDHLNDAIEFLNDKERVEIFKKEMLTMFKQKRDLNLIRELGEDDNKHEITIDKIVEKVEFIFLLAANKHESKELKIAINNLDTIDNIENLKNIELKFATASFMGYGLYSKSMLTLTEFNERFKDRLN
jgi:hypothetical protein